MSEQEKKVAVFIDYENVHICLEKESKAVKLDCFDAFRDKVQDKGRVVTCKAFSIWDYTRDQQKAFEENGITTVPIFLNLKNAVDISLTVDCLAEAYDNDIDIIVMYTGDGGYSPLVNHILDKLGKEVYVFSVKNGAHNTAYKRLKTNHLYIDDIFENELCTIDELKINENLLSIVNILHKALEKHDFMSRKFFISKYLKQNRCFSLDDDNIIGELIDTCLQLQLIKTEHIANPNGEYKTRTLTVNYSHPSISSLDLK